MKVMKRYCDFDYDNNTIILFDATDGESLDDLNITWISSGNTSEQETEKQAKKEKMIPLPEYIEHEYRKKVLKERKRALRKYHRKQQQLMRQELLRQQQQQQQQRHAAQLQHAQAVASSLHATHTHVVNNGTVNAKVHVGAPLVAAQHAKIPQQQAMAQPVGVNANQAAMMAAVQNKGHQQMMMVTMPQQDAAMHAHLQQAMMNGANIQNVRVLTANHSFYAVQ